MLIQQATALYTDEPFRFELQAAADVRDSTTLDLCLALFPWATFRKRKAALKRHTLLTHNCIVPAPTIAQLYQGRWQIALCFKWFKQPLRIKAFYDTSPNAGRPQVWSAIAVYLLVAILKKRLHLDPSLYTMLQILSLTLFEQMPSSQALAQLPPTPTSPDTDNHQCLLAF